MLPYFEDLKKEGFTLFTPFVRFVHTSVVSLVSTWIDDVFLVQDTLQKSRGKTLRRLRLLGGLVVFYLGIGDRLHKSLTFFL